MKPNSFILQRSISVCVFSAVCLARVHSSAYGSVDFENVPGFGVPVETMVINNQYLPSEGMSFSMIAGQIPIIAQVGSPGYAFTGIGGADDLPAAGQGVGSFFLVANSPMQLTSALLVGYSSPVNQAGGVILDIDGAEAWLIQAFDSGFSVIDSVALNTSSFNAGDGLATAWSFTHGAADIAGVRITYTGSMAGGLGYAWDNFTTAVPEPSTAAMLVLGTCWLGVFRRRSIRR